MSIFNDAYSNEFRARFAKVTAEEVWTKDEISGEYFRVAPGGDGGTLPYYLKPNAVEITGGVFNTQIDGNSIGVNNTSIDTGSLLESSTLTFGDISGNVILNKNDIRAANKLYAAINGSVNSVATTDQSLLIYDASASTLKRSSAISLSTSATNFNKISTTGLVMQNPSLSYATIQPNNISLANISKQMVRIKDGSLTLGASTATDGAFVLDTTQPYLNLQTSSIALRTAATTHILYKEDIAVTNNLKGLVNAAPGGTSKMVTYNTSTGVYNHTALPSAAPVVPKTYYRTVTVDDFPCMNDAFTGFRDSRPVKTYAFGDNERIIFDFSTGTKIKYDRWYIVGLAMENAGLKSLIKASHIPYRYSEANSPTTVSCCYYGGTAFTDGVNTVQPYHIAFGVSKSGKTITDDFTGYIEFHKVLHDASTAPTPT